MVSIKSTINSTFAARPHHQDGVGAAAAAAAVGLLLRARASEPFFVTDWLIYGNTRLARLFYPLPRVQPARGQSICMKLAYGVKFGGGRKRIFFLKTGWVPILRGQKPAR